MEALRTERKDIADATSSAGDDDEITEGRGCGPHKT